MNLHFSTKAYRQADLPSVFRLLPAALLFCALAIPFSLFAKDLYPTMPNGIWTIETTPPSNAVELGPEFLPNGTKLRLQVEGPTRLAVEEQRGDELGGTVTLIPPFSLALCNTAIGSMTAFGVNLCRDGVIAVGSHGPIQFDDAVFVFSRLDAKGVADSDNEFFVGRGAKKGARFVTVYLKNKSAEWRLWLKSSNEMVSECIVHLPGKNKIDSFPMIWRRETKH